MGTKSSQLTSNQSNQSDQLRDREITTATLWKVKRSCLPCSIDRRSWWCYKLCYQRKRNTWCVCQWCWSGCGRSNRWNNQRTTRGCFEHECNGHRDTSLCGAPALYTSSVSPRCIDQGMYVFVASTENVIAAWVVSAKVFCVPWSGG